MGLANLCGKSIGPDCFVFSVLATENIGSIIEVCYGGVSESVNDYFATPNGTYLITLPPNPFFEQVGTNNRRGNRFKVLKDCKLYYTHFPAGGTTPAKDGEIDLTAGQIIDPHEVYGISGGRMVLSYVTT